MAAEGKPIAMTTISRINNTPASAGAKKTKAPANSFAPEQQQDTPAPAQTGATTPAATLSALIALQGDGQEPGQRGAKRTFAAAQQMLDALHGLQGALLDGKDGADSLAALKAAAALRGHADADPQLLAIYDEITLRARVELAKLGH